MAPALTVKDLYVTYPGHRSQPPVEAVRGVSFEVHPGECVAVLGPNGAGKTTTLEVCEGLRSATSGQVRVLGLDPGDRAQARELRARCGVVLQESRPTPVLTAREALQRHAGYFPRRRDVDEVLALVGLSEQADMRVRRLSGGQQRRLDVALGLISRPQLIFLDEPTTGFDPGARRDAWQMVAGLRAEGATVLLTTHYIDEAQHLADRVVVLAGGQVVAEGSPETLGGRSRALPSVRFTVPAGQGRPPVLRGDTSSETPLPDGSAVMTVTCSEVTLALHTISGWALQRGLKLTDIRVLRPTLEDIYLELVGQP